MLNINTHLTDRIWELVDPRLKSLHSVDSLHYIVVSSLYHLGVALYNLKAGIYCGSP